MCIYKREVKKEFKLVTDFLERHLVVTSGTAGCSSTAAALKHSGSLKQKTKDNN